MKRAALGQIVRWKGNLHEVIAFADGREVVLRPINKAPCSLCGDLGDVHLVEASPLFQNGVKPVATIGET